MSERRKRVKVSVVLQMEAAECGAACLAMVLGFFGRWIPLERLRQDCGVSRDGSKALYLMKAAEKHGLQSKIKRADVTYLREEASYPCILHWKGAHFVVLCGFKGNKALVADPAHGFARLTLDEFSAKYSGVVLTFQKTEQFEEIARPPLMYTFARDRLEKSGTAVVFLALCTLIAALMAIISPIFTRLFIDQALIERTWGILGIVVGGMTAIALVKLVLEWIRGLQQVHIEAYFSVRANTSYLWHVLRLPIRFFQYRHIGDIVTRQGENETIAYSMVQQLVPLVLNAVMIAVYLVVLFFYQATLALVGLAAVLINIMVMRLTLRRSVELMRIQEHDRGHAVGQTYACVEQIETIKASGAETGFFQRWAGYQALANEKAQKQARLLQFLFGASEMISSLSNVIILILGAYFIIERQFTPGMLLAFQGILGIIAQPMQQMSMMGQSLQKMRVSMERVDDVFQAEPDVADAAFDVVEQPAARLKGEIVMREVSFGYNPLEEPLLSGIDLHIQAGEHVAIVGRSGSGKSTFAHLIDGLYAPWTGSILIDGKELASLALPQLRSSLAVVSQDNHLFSATVEDNLRMWDRSIDFECIEQAAQDAQVDDLIRRRKEAYRERIIDGGVQFSGGQRQQLEIARALAANPSILILDEATSALDAKTEVDVLAALKARDITLVMIAHRLSTIRDCDRIVVIDGGRIAEVGNHEQLMQQDGAYANLIRSN